MGQRQPQPAHPLRVAGSHDDKLADLTRAPLSAGARCCTTWTRWRDVNLPEKVRAQSSEPTHFAQVLLRRASHCLQLAR